MPPLKYDWNLKNRCCSAIFVVFRLCRFSLPTNIAKEELLVKNTNNREKKVVDHIPQGKNE
jgi:hypothetical protein